jgi:hypothetical protein
MKSNTMAIQKQRSKRSRILGRGRFKKSRDNFFQCKNWNIPEG